jgi:hypothetical protein
MYDIPEPRSPLLWKTPLQFLPGDTLPLTDVQFSQSRQWHGIQAMGSSQQPGSVQTTAQVAAENRGQRAIPKSLLQNPVLLPPQRRQADIVLSVVTPLFVALHLPVPYQVNTGAGAAGA